MAQEEKLIWLIKGTKYEVLDREITFSEFYHAYGGSSCPRMHIAELIRVTAPSSFDTRLCDVTGVTAYLAEHKGALDWAVKMKLLLPKKKEALVELEFETYRDRVKIKVKGNEIGYLLEINRRTGRFNREPAVDESLGFDLDSMGRIKEEEQNQ